MTTTLFLSIYQSKFTGSSRKNDKVVMPLVVGEQKGMKLIHAHIDYFVQRQDWQVGCARTWRQ